MTRKCQSNKNCAYHFSGRRQIIPGIWLSYNKEWEPKEIGKQMEQILNKPEPVKIIITNYGDFKITEVTTVHKLRGWLEFKYSKIFTLFGGV